MRFCVLCHLKLFVENVENIHIFRVFFKTFYDNNTFILFAPASESLAEFKNNLNLTLFYNGKWGVHKRRRQSRRGGGLS